MDLRLQDLVQDHFEKIDEIKDLQTAQKDITRQVFQKIVDDRAFEFVTINWKALYRTFSKSKR